MRSIRTILTISIVLTLLAAMSVGVGAQSSESAAADPIDPVEFSGRIGFGGQVRFGTIETVDSVERSRGSAWAPSIVEMSDPRLDGRATISFDTDAYTGSDGTSYSLGSGTWRIETAEGAWQGSYNIVEPDGYSSTVTTALIGEGAYEGLVAVWESSIGGSGWDVRGVIYPAGPPEPPTAP